MLRDSSFSGLRRLAAVMCLLLPALAVSQSDTTDLQTDDELRIERPAGAGAATLRMSGPDGWYKGFDFAADDAIVLAGTRLAEVATRDGDYVWEVHFQWSSPRSRDDATDSAAVSLLQPAVGTFRVLDGSVYLSGDEAASRPAGESAPILNDVIIGDLTVRDSLCVGFDCLDAESFGSDTLRLKENNLRLHFEDTSTTTGFAGNDWTLVANEEGSGGANMFAIQDRSAGRNLMTLTAGAPANSLFMNNAGNIGLGTASPALELHVADGDSPSVRLDQTTASGFAAQVWDVVGNEANFFVRDVTGGSNLVFRLIPGAPENSIYVAPSGNVGLGTSSPQARLHVAGGDVRVDGSVYQLSSRAVKTDFLRMEPARLLELVEGLDLGVWRYLAGADDGRHFGPAAEDFHAAFGLGESEERISISDMAGVALGAAQALKQQIDQRDRKIESLEARLERLEQALLETPAEAGRR